MERPIVSRKRSPASHRSEGGGKTVATDQVKPERPGFENSGSHFRILANSISLEGFGEETERGYSALTRTFFAWSVFERYTDLCEIHCPYVVLAQRLKVGIARIINSSNSGTVKAMSPCAGL